MNFDNLPALLATLVGGSGGLAVLVKALMDYFRGRVEDEKAYNRRMIKEARDNDERADMEVQNRFEWQTYASRLKRMLIERGVPIEEIPPEPVNRQCPNRID